MSSDTEPKSPAEGAKSKKKPSVTQQVAQAIIDNVFTPTHAMRMAKAKFDNMIRNNSLIDPEALSVLEISRLVKNQSITKWWREQPGFKDWFLDTEIFPALAEVAAHKALMVLMDVMENGENENARVNAAKAAIEVANRLPQKYKEVKFLDADIGKMSREQLEQVVETGTPKLVEGQ